MKNWLLALLLVMFLPLVSYSQSEKLVVVPDSVSQSTDQLAQFFKEHYSTEEKLTFAAFVWTSQRFSYDFSLVGKFSEKQEIISNALKTRKAVCTGYAEVFNEILNKSGIKSYVIPGITRQENELASLAHAWVGAFVDDTWYLFDPTWSSGGMLKNHFVKNYDPDYFKVEPTQFLHSHFPFDPLFQFLHHPISFKEFKNSKTDQDNVTFFAFEDSLSAYEKSDEQVRLRNSLVRIKETGAQGPGIDEFVQAFKMDLENSVKNNRIALFNAATNKLNFSVSRFNEYIKFKNRQFKSVKSMTDLKTELGQIQQSLDSANTSLEEITIDFKEIYEAKTDLSKAIKDLEKRVKSEINFVQKYINTPHSERLALFYRKTN